MPASVRLNVGFVADYAKIGKIHEAATRIPGVHWKVTPRGEWERCGLVLCGLASGRLVTPFDAPSTPFGGLRLGISGWNGEQCSAKSR